MAQKATIDAINTMVVGLKSDGVWDKITEAYLMAGVTFGGITVKLKGSGTLTNNNFVTGDYTVTGSGAGLTGKASATLDTGLLADSFDEDDIAFGGYVTAKTGNNIMGGVWGTADVADIWNIQTNSARIPLERGVGFTQTDGMIVGSRRGSADAEAYVNGSSVGTNTITRTRTLPNLNWYVCARNDNGTPTTGMATSSFHFIGTGLTDTDASNLSTRVNTLMTALGCNTY